MGTVSFIEPTRPEYKILAVYFRDEITRPLLQPAFANSTSVAQPDFAGPLEKIRTKRVGLSTLGIYVVVSNRVVHGIGIGRE